MTNKNILLLIFAAIILAMGILSFFNGNIQTGVNLLAMVATLYFLTFLHNQLTGKKLKTVFYTSARSPIYVAALMAVVLVNSHLFSKNLDVRNPLILAFIGALIGAFSQFGLFEYLKKLLARQIQKE